jgi:hypothetical protein
VLSGAVYSVSSWWLAHLSEATGAYLLSLFDVLPVADGSELSTKDVDPQWLGGELR